MKIVIGVDEARLRLKSKFKEFLVSNGHEIIDYSIRNLTSILTMRARVIGSELAEKNLATWLNALFIYNRSTTKIDQ